MTFDVIIIGLGASGSSALYHVAKTGASVLGIDQFVPPHTYGSTHSESRIFRKAYFEGTEYLPLLRRAYSLWLSLENESSTTLMHPVGCLTIGDADSDMIRQAKKSGEMVEANYRLLSSKEVHERYPAYRLNDRQVALVDFEAGYLQPELCVRTYLRRAAAHRAQCLFGEPVITCATRENGVLITTTNHKFEARKVILTAGAWMRDFVEIPMEIERVTNSWFRPVGLNCIPSTCPPFIYCDDQGDYSYGCPDLGYGFKIGLHHKGPTISHPNALDRNTTLHDMDPVLRVVEQIIPEAAGACLKTTVCMYSNLPDYRFLIDYLRGDDPTVVVGSACSGHGFKASSAIGECLAALALGDPPPVDLSPFSWTRIHQSSNETVS